MDAEKPQAMTREELAKAPFRLLRPARPKLPFVVASPHSGRIYPTSFLEQTRLAFSALRRSEDAFVDALFQSAVTFGAPLIAASFPRAFLDVNRAPTEIDAGMFDGPLPFSVDSGSPRVHAGLGVIPRLVREGAEIYDGKLAPAEADERLALFFRPYHAALASLIEDALKRFGFAVVLDCHSMPSAAAVPDIVIGDRYGAAASSLLVHAAEACFARQGFSIGRNVPYAGGYTTQLHGRPGQYRHAIQIEINRALYMHEDSVRPSAALPAVRARIEAALHGLFSTDLSGLAPLRHAAE